MLDYHGCHLAWELLRKVRRLPEPPIARSPGQIFEFMAGDWTAMLALVRENVAEDVKRSSATFSTLIGAVEEGSSTPEDCKDRRVRGAICCFNHVTRLIPV